MDKYQALKSVWENNQIVYAEDESGIQYKFIKENDQFKYTRVELDEWCNTILVTEFLRNFKNYK